MGGHSELLPVTISPPEWPGMHPDRRNRRRGLGSVQTLRALVPLADSVPCTLPSPVLLARLHWDQAAFASKPLAIATSATIKPASFSRSLLYPSSRGTMTACAINA